LHCIIVSESSHSEKRRDSRASGHGHGEQTAGPAHIAWLVLRKVGESKHSLWVRPRSAAAPAQARFHSHLLLLRQSSTRYDHSRTRFPESLRSQQRDSLARTVTMPGRLAAQILPPTIPSTVGAEQLGAKKNERSREREHAGNLPSHPPASKFPGNKVPRKFLALSAPALHTQRASPFERAIPVLHSECSTGVLSPGLRLGQGILIHQLRSISRSVHLKRSLQSSGGRPLTSAPDRRQAQALQRVAPPLSTPCNGMVHSAPSRTASLRLYPVCACAARPPGSGAANRVALASRLSSPFLGFPRGRLMNVRSA
jgi:hypothetical protein